MARVKKERPNIWGNDYKPYGTYEGEAGSRRQWKKAFEHTMGLNEAKEAIKSDSPWIVLGVTMGDSFETIKKAFRAMCFKTHPDYGGTSEAFRKVNASYTILKERYGK